MIRIISSISNGFRIQESYLHVLTYFSTGYVTAIGTLTGIIEKNSFSVGRAKEYSIMVLAN